jgi:MoaA/NifB/PqqE/SkfB family radical SAM enzyme
MTFDQIVSITSQFQEHCNLHGYSGQLTFTGGEPLIRRDLFDILEHVLTHHPSFRFAILTNGTLLTHEAVRKLSEFHPLFVQVSIDGSERTHDEIRGKGSYISRS